MSRRPKLSVIDGGLGPDGQPSSHGVQAEPTERRRHDQAIDLGEGRGMISVPEPYEIWADGTFHRTTMMIPATQGEPPIPNILECLPRQHVAGLERVAQRPVFVSAIGAEAATGLQRVELTFVGADNVTRSHWVPASTLTNAKALAELADVGLPADDPRALSRYLTVAQTHVGLVRGATLVGDRLGWVSGTYADRNGQPKDIAGWLLGETFIGTGSVRPNESSSLMEGCRVAGEADDWVRRARGFMNDASDGWFVRAMVGVAFASPLLRVLDIRTFFVHHYCQSGGAKTSLARFGQSVYGHPKKLERSLIRATQTALTEIFKEISDLSLLIDETQGKDDKINLTDFIMQACSEVHKARSGRSGGVLATRKDDGGSAWRLIVRTTGERPITGADRVDLGGEANRVIEVNVGVRKDLATEIFNWTERPTSYGHAGRTYLSKLHAILGQENGRETLRARFETLRSTFRHRSDLKSAQLAVIALGEALMLEWIFGMSENDAGQMAVQDVSLLVDKMRDTGTVSLVEQALEALKEHRLSQPGLWADATTDEGRKRFVEGTKNSKALFAVYKAGPEQNEIWMFPSEVRELLRKRFQTGVDRVIDDLAAAGHLKRDSKNEKRCDPFRQITGMRHRCYVMPSSSLRDLPAEDPHLLSETVAPTPPAAELAPRLCVPAPTVQAATEPVVEVEPTETTRQSDSDPYDWPEDAYDSPDDL